MALSELRLKALKTNPSPGKHADRDGLYVRIDKKGAMRWQWRIRTPAGENTVSYGVYPEVGLAEARHRHMAARAQLRDGVNPNEAKRAAKRVAAALAVNTLQAVTLEWFSTREAEWSPSYSTKILRSMELNVFPYLGSTPVSDITAPVLLEVLRKIERRGALETSHRALQTCSQVMRYAIATGRISSDPARDLKDALRRPTVKHMPAIVKPDLLAGLLRAIDGYAGTHVVRTALQLAPMLMLRPGELRFARWEEFDLNSANWSIEPTRMKRRREGKLNGAPHLVPLPRQAVERLRALLPLTGPTGYVFRGERDHERAMSENTVNAALRRMGYDTRTEMTGHGFRAIARTLLDEVLGFDRAVIEAQLAHSVKDGLGRAYNRTEFLGQRRAMLQAWADYLDKLRTPDLQESPGNR